jgi:hypothetical protein
MTIYKQGKPLPTIEIKRGIPIPSSRNESGLKAIALDMQVGDCIDVPYSRTPVGYNLARVTGFEFTQRRKGDVLRIWRIA